MTSDRRASRDRGSRPTSTHVSLRQYARDYAVLSSGYRVGRAIGSRCRSRTALNLPWRSASRGMGLLGVLLYRAHPLRSRAWLPLNQWNIGMILSGNNHPADGEREGILVGVVV